MTESSVMLRFTRDVYHQYKRGIKIAEAWVGHVAFDRLCEEVGVPLPDPDKDGYVACTVHTAAGAVRLVADPWAPDDGWVLVSDEQLARMRKSMETCQTCGQRLPNADKYFNPGEGQ